MRQIVLDTETTGLYANKGDRLVEIACVEINQRRLTGNTRHFYVNPKRDSDPAALAVHGLTTEFLSAQPLFSEVAQALCDFVQGAEVIIHNAPFDISFLNAELQRLDRPHFDTYCHTVTDTLKNARERFPGKRNSLDALCDRFHISRAHRTLHGALLDAELLAQVYLAMTCGQEELLITELAAPPVASTWSTATQASQALMGTQAASLIVIEATPEEKAEHTALLSF